MRFPLLTLFCCLSFFFASAQNYDDRDRFAPGSTLTVFSDTAYIRATPSTAGPAIDSLYAFENLRLLRIESATLTLGRKTAPWYRVSYTRNGAERKGFIWGGAVALKAFRHQGVQFAGAVLSYPDPKASTVEDSGIEIQYISTFSIKAKSAEARGECRYNINRESVYFGELTDTNGIVTDKHWMQAKGIPAGASFLVNFGMNGGACGVPSYTIIAAWDGRSLIRMPLLQDNADGGDWMYQEAYVYPSQKQGKAGILRIKATSETSVEGSDKMETEVSWKEYRYDTMEKRFVLLDTKK